MSSETMILGTSAVLLALGACGVLVRRNPVAMLMSIELMLNAVNVMLVAFNRWSPGELGGQQSHTGQVFAFFVIAVAAAEAAVGLAIVIGFFRLKRTVETDAATLLKH